MQPRSQAAELKVDMSAIREVANLSARTAINKHALKQAADRRPGKLVMTALGAAGTLFFSVRSTMGSAWAFELMLASGVFTLGALAWYVRECLRFRDVHKESQQIVDR
jgi:hypothetical protein